MTNSQQQYVSKIAQDLRNGVKHDKRSITKLAASFGIADLNLIKELTELAIVTVARELAHQPNKTTKQRYDDIVALYRIQTNLSHRTSTSILLQQYSTPAPIGYLMGVYCGIDTGNKHLLEPSAGNGLLTIAGNPSFTTVNEVDSTRNNNLQTQGFITVTAFDASKSFPYNYHRNYEAVITNPPFGKLDTDVTFDGFDIGELDHVMAIRALECMEDSGRAAIIIGGHTKYDDVGRITAGKNRKFISYLYRHYQVDDIIPIDGHALYSRQGTSFDTRLILISGRKKTPGGYAPLNTAGDQVCNSFEDLYERVISYTKPTTNTVDMKLKLAKAKAKALKLKLSMGELGMPYVPASDACNKLDVDVPDSMGFETSQALERIKKAIGGDIDEYVREKLGYSTKIDLCKALAAEQIDAVALAIYNMENLGQGMIIGDQTGIGKGRQAAAVIRYAFMQGKRPIFITEKPNLFSDIYRDLKAIGSGDLVPYIINASEAKTKVKDEDGNVIYEPLDAATQKKILAEGKLPKGYDYVMLTYSQISDSEFNKKTGQLLSLSPKASFIYNLAQDNVLIMDESHNASGDSNTGKVLRMIVEETQGVVFLSATFAKRADNMPIYALKTAISEANMSKDDLIEAIEKGGVALQEVLAAQLVQQGQMLRRERTFEGIEVNYLTLTEKEQEHKAISDNITSIVRDIIAFQEKYVMPEIQQMNKTAAVEQSSVELRKGTGKAGVDATPYFSKIFNVINQLLFAIKAESVADHAIKRLREGKKPVIAFSSTMGAFIDNLKDDFGMPVDDGLKINADFANVLIRGLEGVLRYTVRGADGKSTFKKFDITELSPEAQNEYNRIGAKISNTVSGIVLSPIDLVKQRIEAAGYSVAEVTGRKFEVQLREAAKGEALPENPKPKGRIPADAAKVIPPMQLSAVKTYLDGEEGEYFEQLLNEIDTKAKELRKRDLEKEQRKWEKEREDSTTVKSYYKDVALPTFRYFNGSSDVFVFEWDEAGQAFYTFTILNGDVQNAEFGWQSIKELFGNYGFGRTFEMDFSYNPKPIRKVLESEYQYLSGFYYPDSVKSKGFGRATDTNTAKQYIGLIRPRKKENVFDAFNKFNNNEVDVLMINQSGSTGASAHAIVTKKVPLKDVKQRVMIVLQAELDINREVQKRGRVNRTGQVYKPIYDYISSAIPAEKRLMMMLQKKLKSLDANTTSNQRNSEDLMKSDDFLNEYGDKVVAEYLAENPELNEALGDILEGGKSDSDSGAKGAFPEISSKATGRVAILDTRDQERFYTEVLERYNKFVELLKAQDEYNLEVETMDLQAKTIESKVVVVGKGGRSAFGDNTILEKCEVNILKKPYSITEIDNLLQAELKGITPQDYQAELLQRMRMHFENKLKVDLAENENYYKHKIEQIVTEKGYKDAANSGRPDIVQLYVDTRTKELNQAKEEKAERISVANMNQQSNLSEIVRFFMPGKMLYYPSDVSNADMGKSLAVFIGFSVNEKARNPFAPSAIDAKIAIASSKKFIPYPLSRQMEINAIIGASRNAYGTWDRNGRDDWAKHITENTKDRGIRYILTGNVLQAFGWNNLTKPKLISFTTDKQTVRKGILLSEDWSSKNQDGTDAQQYTIVPIGKAVKVIKSMSVNASIISESGLSISKQGDDFRLIVPRSRSVGGDIYLDKELLELVIGNNFNLVSNSMLAIVPGDNIDAACKVLQKNHGVSVRLLGWQVDIIKDEISDNKFNDEVQLPKPTIQQIAESSPNVLIVRPDTPNNRLVLAKAKAKALRIKLQLLDMDKPLSGYRDNYYSEFTEAFGDEITNYQEFKQFLQNVEKPLYRVDSAPDNYNPEEHYSGFDKDEAKSEFERAKKYRVHGWDMEYNVSFDELKVNLSSLDELELLKSMSEKEFKEHFSEDLEIGFIDTTNLLDKIGYGEDVEAISNIDYFVMPYLNKSTNDLINDVQNQLPGLIDESFDYDGRTIRLAVNSNRKYNDIDVYTNDDEGSEVKIGTIKLRIANHSYNPQNNSRSDYEDGFISVVIANKDATKDRFHGKHNIYFDEDNTVSDVAIEVEEKIREIIEWKWDIEQRIKDNDGVLGTL